MWSQQGAKLVGAGAVGFAYQGISVALSADGNIALVGGYYDSSGAGATWVYARSAGAWSAPLPKLLGTGAVREAFQGVSVALSADGNTALVGGYNDDAGVGAAWVFVQAPSTGLDGGRPLAFALEGARPNPTMGSGVRVAFELPTDATAVLELLDVGGRRVLAREVGSLGAGRHTVNLAEDRKVAPGLYWVRLAQGASRRVTRVAVTE